MVATCLMKDPSKRPSAKKLLKHSFFKQARSNDYIARKLLEGLPPLGDRIKELKVDTLIILVISLIKFDSQNISNIRLPVIYTYNYLFCQL